MKQTFKMKQTFNKFSLGILFVLVFGLLLVPQYKADAQYALVAELNGGGVGGNGTTTTTTTTTVAPVTGSISFIANLDKNVPYVANSDMILTTSALVNTCGNTDLYLKVRADITGPNSFSKDLGVLVDQFTTGGQKVDSVTTLKAPANAGIYTINFTADRYDPSGYALKDFSGTTLLGVYDREVVVDTGTHYYITTNYRGRITKVTTLFLQEVSIEYIKYSSIKDIYGNPMTVPAVGEDLIKTYTTSLNFEVVVLSVKVYVNDSTTNFSLLKDAAINTGVRVSWDSKNATDCTCTTSASYIDGDGISKNSCGSGIGTEVIGKTPLGFTLFKIPDTTTFSVTCKYK